MDKERLCCRIGFLPSSFPAVLDEFVLLFNKRKNGGVCANIIPDKEGTVYGVVYRFTDSSLLERIDPYEGYPIEYRREAVYVKAIDLKTSYSATTYIANDAFIVPPQLPEEEYLSHLIQGAEMHGLPEAYIATLRSFHKGCFVGNGYDK